MVIIIIIIYNFIFNTYLVFRNGINDFVFGKSKYKHYDSGYIPYKFVKSNKEKSYYESIKKYIQNIRKKVFIMYLCYP